MSLKQFGLAALGLLSIVQASPCPYGNLAERGELPEAEAAKFFAARAEGESAVEEMMHKQKREFAEQEEFYKRQVEKRQLTLGGGLLNGALLPFTGVLSALHVPTPQKFGLVEIPGDDGKHPFIKPKKTDVRGMCPTLNTMANHGFISRDGITTFAEAANACQITLGFGYDTCTFLSALGLLAGGDLPSGKYSIGGADSRVPNTLGPSQGISRHGFFEVDQSISRQDAYFGNQADFKLARFNQLRDITKKYGGQFGNNAFAEERVLTYQQSKDTNPEFNAGIRWLGVTTAERVFIFRAMPNGTTLGNANNANVLPFYLNETFPNEWFVRPNPYSLVETGTDIANLLATSPGLTTPGQNQGLGNFVPLGLDLDSITPASALCFLSITALDEIPGSFSGASATVLAAVQGFVNGAIAPFFPNSDSAACKAIAKYAQNGPSAGTKPGVSTTKNYLVNGVYQ